MTMRRFLAVAAVGCLAVAARPAVAGAPAAAPATTAPASAPASAPEAVDPAVLKILKDLEVAGEKHATIRADIDYHVELRSLGDTEMRTGWVAYQKARDGGSAQFRVTFLTLQQGEGPKTREEVDYAFDGQWLTVAKHRIKTMTMYQLAAEGQRIEPLRIGKGPFPLPFGQRTDDVLKHFTVSTRPAADGDPKDTIYLRLITRPAHAEELATQRLEMWIDRATSLPVRICSLDKNRNVTTVTFKNLQTNRDLPADLFRIPPKLGWQTERRPFESDGKPEK